MTRQSLIETELNSISGKDSLKKFAVPLQRIEEIDN